MDVYETITRRRTIRKFRQKRIDLAVLKKMVNAGRLAPSSANLQPLQYFVADHEQLKKKVFPNLAWAGYIKPEGDPGEGEEPAAYIIILADREINKAPEYDIGASACSINLAAEEEGIGCCWIGSFRKKQLADILGLPAGITPELVLALGYPAESPVPEDVDPGSSIKYYKDDSGELHVPKRKLEDIIHLNRF